MRLFFLLCTLLVSASLLAQPSPDFPLQPVSRAARLGGDAEFSYRVRTPNFSFEWVDLYSPRVIKDGVDVSARFTLIAQSNYTEPRTSPITPDIVRVYTLRITGVTAADAGTYRFSVRNEGYAIESLLSQPVTLTISDAAAAALPQLAALTPGFTAEQGTSGGFPLQVTLAPGSPASTYQWYHNGRALTGETSATYRRPLGAQLGDTGVYHVVVTNAAGALTSEPILVLVRSGEGPVIERQPSPTEVAIGWFASFSVATRGSGSGPLRYQWLFNGRAIWNATDSSVNINYANPLHAGEYSVIVMDERLGAIVSQSARLTVVPPSLPVITTHPQSVTQVEGYGVRLFATALGQPFPQCRWHKDGVAIAGATSSDLSIPSARASDAGVYTYVATNSAGSVVSQPATVTVTPASAYDPARLVNLSVLARLQPGETMTLGTVLGGTGTAGTKPLLLRAAGPSLTPLGLSSVLPDPRLELYSGQAIVGANDNWGGTAVLRAIASAVGAFTYESDTSRDAALYQPALPAGAYTLQVRGHEAGPPGTLGGVLAELYDATPAGTLTATTPRLINISLLKNCIAPQVITVGFVIRGTGIKTVLIRAIGQQLAQPPFNIAPVVTDPTLSLSRPDFPDFARNDDWSTQTGGTPVANIVASASAVGAFPLAPGSKDAALLARLGAGSYTVEVYSKNASSGLMLVEVYDLP